MTACRHSSLILIIFITGLDYLGLDTLASSTHPQSQCVTVWHIHIQDACVDSGLYNTFLTCCWKWPVTVFSVCFILTFVFKRSKSAATHTETRAFWMGARASALPRPRGGMGSCENVWKCYSNKHQPKHFFHLFPGLYNIFNFIRLHICAHLFALFLLYYDGGTLSLPLWQDWGCWWLDADKFGGHEKVKHGHTCDFAVATRYLS